MLSFKMISNNPEKRFWDWFIENEKYIYENVENPKEQEKIFDKMSQLLSKIDENLVFEFSPIKENGIRELSLSVDGIENSFPLVEKMISKSPKLKNWKFNAFRQRIPGDEFEIKYDTYKIGYDDIFYRYSLENNELGIELNIRNFDNSHSN